MRSLIVASTGNEIISKTKELNPDIILLDISMPEVENLSFCKKIKEISPNTKIIILTMHFSEEYVKEAFKNGAEGYILKDSSFSELEIAIKSVFEGHTYITPKVSKVIIKDYLQKEQNPLKTLTERQKEILKLIAEGYSSKEIAYKLNISIKTVEAHKSQIMEKLNIYDIPGLVKFAIKNKLIDL